MRFRTEIDIRPSATDITHGDRVLLLGSCFTDNIGSRLVRDGFDATANPFEALYNPMSLATLLERALERRYYTASELRQGPRGYHCLDFATAYSGADADALTSRINTTLESISTLLHGNEPLVAIITFGSAFVYSAADNGAIVGNCHKFPASFFERRRLSCAEIVERWNPLLERMHRLPSFKKLIFTISPIRHLADGLHGNTLSKSTLQLATDTLCSANTCAEYFPAYEILIDDLRDYRFYAADMKHPSDVAADYVYERFADAYFTTATRAVAEECRRQAAAAAHRPILD